MSVLERTTSAPPTLSAPGPGYLHRVRQWLRARRASMLWLVPTLVLAGLVQGINMAGSPQRIDDEGTYTAQAWAVDRLGELAHYTYWYDHPPLGWLQIAAYAKVTNAFSRWDVAVMAGREAMLAAALISTVLVFVLSRRLGLGRAAAAVAGLIFALSPLAVQFHRTVYLDNVATPWLLAAFVLALSRHRQLTGFAGAAAAFGIAVLSKETFLLALPFLAWTMYRSAHPQTRRYTLSVAGSVLVLIGASYVLLATVKGELLPGSGHVSLVNGISFQLASRKSSGSLFDPGSLINRTLGMWWQLDPIGISMGLLAAIAGLWIARVRILAMLVLMLTAFMFRPGGYLPVPYVIMLLPFAAILIAGTTETALSRVRRRHSAHHTGDRGRLRRGTAGLWITVTALALAGAAVLWTGQLRGLLLANLDRPTLQAQQWVISNTNHHSRIIVDDSLWVDLVNAGFARENVIWYYKIDTDPAVAAQSPHGWKDSDYIVTTDSMRTFPDQFPEVKKAIDNSLVVASFGSGTQQVQIRKIYKQGLPAERQQLSIEQNRKARVGAELTRNKALTLTPTAKDNLDAGQVDSRILVDLTVKLATNTLTVKDFPTVAGENGKLRRQVLISAIDGHKATPTSPGAAAAASWLNHLTGIYKPDHVQSTPDGVLASFTITEPSNVLPASPANR